MPFRIAIASLGLLSSLVLAIPVEAMPVDPIGRKRGEGETFVEVTSGASPNARKVAGRVAVRKVGSDGKARKAPSGDVCESEPYIENDLLDPVENYSGSTLRIDSGEEALPILNRRMIATEVGGSDRNDDGVFAAASTGRLYSPTGRWVYLSCFDAAGDVSFLDIAPVGGPPVTLGDLFAEAMLEIDPAVHDFTINPEGKQLVQFPTLFWVEPDYWDTERAATKSNGNVSLTVTLTPFQSEWNPGDGSNPILCDGPGQIWEDGLEGETFYCKHTYRTVAGQPFTATSAVRFRVETETNSNETLGPFPSLERVATFEVGVREIQVVETSG